LVVICDIAQGEEIYVAYGQHYWKGFQDLSYDKALMEQHCYNLESLPPYNPYAPSHAKPCRELRTSTETEFTCLLATEVGSHTFLQLPFTVLDVNSGVESLRWNQLKLQHTDITSIQLHHVKQDMQVATLNVGGLGQFYMKVTDLCYQFSLYRLDVLCLQDTHHTEKDLPFINTLIKDLLPSGTEIRHSPLPSEGSGRKIGGQLIIISLK
jgi:hypothetical protein